MLIALVYTMILAVIVTAMAYLISTEIRSVGFQLDDTKALYLAQAGVERAVREIRDEVLTPPQTGTADLRGADTSLCVSIGNQARLSYIDASNATINANTDQAIIRTFDSNYTQAKIISVLFYVRASGSGATIQLSYTTDGTNYVNAGSTFLLTGSLADYNRNITGSLTWATMMSSNFRLRVMRTNSTGVNIDAIWLRVTYTIDTNTEPWYTGTYTAFPVTLGDGFIQSVSIVDEARKVNLNYASKDLLKFLIQRRGVNTGTANTLVDNIVDHRDGPPPNPPDPFDSVEELLQIDRMTPEIYDLIKDYVTVYSFVNINSYRTAASRAPVNINTAPLEVLEAVFDGVLTTSLSAQLANDIVSTRTTTPFTCFYNSNAAVTTDFYDFVNTRSYLNAARRNQVLYITDASLLIPVSGYNPANPPQKTTEFCYANTTYKIDSVGRITLGPAENIDLRVQTVIGDDGSRKFPTYVGDTVLTGYWKESYE